MLIPSNKQPGASLKWPSRRAFVLNHMRGGCYSVDVTVPFSQFSRENWFKKPSEESYF